MEFDLPEIKRRFDYHEDGYLIWKISPSNNVSIGDVAGYLAVDGYWKVSIFNKPYLLHRIIYFWHHGILPELIDHKDRNPLNNQIENLRASDKIRNGLNRDANKNSKSGIKGITFDANRNKWVAQLRISPRNFSKRFTSKAEAICWLEETRRNNV